MGKVVGHLEIELLSALADGELDLSTMRDADEHLAVCAACAGQLDAFRRIDDVLLTPARLSCEGARELRSAFLDGELTADEAQIALGHLAQCADCGADQVVWSSLDTTLKTLPTAMPSARTDARIARLTAPEQKLRLPLAGPTALRPVALRGAVAIAVGLAILVGLLPGGPGGEQAQQAPDIQSALVASVQQVVFYSPTNTLYVVQASASAVDAVDASSLALRARIAVGGRPAALALSASSVLVLDPGQRSLVEIDTASNTVVGSTQISVAGTPTSLLVDPNNGRIIVAAIPDPAGGAAATPVVTTVDNSGVVAVLDPTTKKVETVSAVDVAPKLVVTDASGKQTLLVSPGGTTVVGPNFKKIKTLPGGVSAAFAPGRDLIAVLSRETAGAVVSWSGDGAPDPVHLIGSPVAMTSVPDVGFAVLLGSGKTGRIVVIDQSGRPVGSTDVTAVGRDLTYDAAARRFTVVGADLLITTALPPGLVADASPNARETAAPAARPSPDVSRDASAAPSATPSTSAAPSSSASASPSLSLSPSPSAAPSGGPLAAPSAPVVAAPSLPVGLPKNSTIVGPGLYHVGTEGRVPVLVAATPLRVWFLDTTNGLNALNVTTGEALPIAQLPADADISSIAVGADAVYAADAKNSRLWALDLKTEQLSSRPLPYIDAQTIMSVGDDGRIWFASADQGQIVSYDPRGRRVELVEATAGGVTAIALDGLGRLWFTDGDHALGRYDPSTGRIERYRLNSKGAARILVADPSGSLWVGTTAGEILSVRDGVQQMPFVAARPITALALDHTGVAWYLTPSPAGRGGFVMGRIYGSSSLVRVPGPATSLTFSAGGRTWLADPAGGFYVFTDAPR